MLTEIKDSIKATLYERATSPLTASFFCAWIAHNYDVVLIVLSTSKPIEKIVYIKYFAFPDALAIFVHGFLLPLVYALVYLYVYPYPARMVFKHTRENQKALKDIQVKIEDETPLTNEQSREIRRKNRALEEEWERVLSDRQEVIEKLQKEISDLKNDHSEAIRQNSVEPPSANHEMPYHLPTELTPDVLESKIRDLIILVENVVLASSKSSKYNYKVNCNNGILEIDFTNKANRRSFKLSYQIITTGSTTQFDSRAEIIARKIPEDIDSNHTSLIRSI